MAATRWYRSTLRSWTLAGLPLLKVFCMSTDLFFRADNSPTRVNGCLTLWERCTEEATGSSLPVAECLSEKSASKRETLRYLLYPHVFKEYGQSRQLYGEPTNLPTLTYLYGLKDNEEIAVDLEKGKRLYISLETIGEPDEAGERNVFFELNGQARSITVRDRKRAPKISPSEKAAAGDSKQIGAPLAGALVALDVKAGQSIKKDDRLFTIEAMKMQTFVKAPADARVKRVLGRIGTKVDVGDLIVEFE